MIQRFSMLSVWGRWGPKRVARSREHRALHLQRACLSVGTPAEGGRRRGRKALHCPRVLGGKHPWKALGTWGNPVPFGSSLWRFPGVQGHALNVLSFMG